MKLHNGYIHIDLEHIKQKEELSQISDGQISFRYDEVSEKIDLSLTSGTLSDISFIPFGKPFLLEEQYQKIEELKNKQ